MRVVLSGLVMAFLIAGCQAGPSGRDSTALFMASMSEFNSGPWKVSAAPVRGTGFKLKLSITTDQLMVGSVEGEGSLALGDGEAIPTKSELVILAQKAAPDGCQVIDIVKDGEEFLAEFDCDS